MNRNIKELENIKAAIKTWSDEECEDMFKGTVRQVTERIDRLIASQKSTIEIIDCMECKHCHVNSELDYEYQYFCRLESNFIMPHDEIPEWCPLYKIKN